MKTAMNKILEGDVLDRLRDIPKGSVQTIVTSPPYWALRNYGDQVASHWPEVTYSLFGFEITVPEWNGQLGLEDEPKAFIGHLVHVFRQLWQVLRDDGTAWVNIGDSYAAKSKNRTQEHINGESSSIAGRQNQACLKQGNKVVEGLKSKDMVGIPWMLAFALREDGWYLRQDVIWHKPNSMPESVKDRCTKAHENIFLFNSEAIKEPASEKTNTRYSKVPDGWETGKESHGSFHRNGRGKGRKISGLGTGVKSNISFEAATNGHIDYRNKRSVWEILPEAFSEAHFATFPQKLVEPCIKAGSRYGDMILDPFGGSGTTGIVAQKLGRKFLLIEQNPEYVAIAQRRFDKEFGMFNPLSNSINQ